jgi:hypothetical protein
MNEESTIERLQKITKEKKHKNLQKGRECRNLNERYM